MSICTPIWRVFNLDAAFGSQFQKNRWIFVCSVWEISPLAFSVCVSISSSEAQDKYLRLQAHERLQGFRRAWIGGFRRISAGLGGSVYY